MTETQCGDIKPVINIIRAVLNLVQWAIPVIIIVLGTFDLAKAAMASKEDEIKAAQKLLIKRVVYAVVIFLVPAIVKLVFNIVSTNVETPGVNFWYCWSNTTSDGTKQPCPIDPNTGKEVCG